MIYQFKQGPHLRAGLNAQAIGEALERLGNYTPSDVVEAARPADSPMHDHFSWDISGDEAIQRVLEQEAKYLVRAIVAVVQEGTGSFTAPGFVSIVAREEDGPSYIGVVEALTDADYREQVLASALDDFVALKRRYSQLHELSRIFAAIEQTIAAREQAVA